MAQDTIILDRQPEEKLLTFEEFRMNTSEIENLKRRMPFNNFSLYFVKMELPAPYREHPWFKKFYAENHELVDKTTALVTETRQSLDPGEALARTDIQQQLYEAYMVAHRYADNKTLFS